MKDFEEKEVEEKEVEEKEVPEEVGMVEDRGDVDMVLHDLDAVEGVTDVAEDPGDT